MASAQTTDSPHQARTLSREDATPGLKAYAASMRARHQDPIRTSPQQSLPTHKSSDTATTLTGVLPTTTPATPIKRDKGKGPALRIDTPLLGPHQQTREDARLGCGHGDGVATGTGLSTYFADVARHQAQYARQVAYSTVTQNGRRVKAKATTEVARRHCVVYGSAYTRPSSEVLREVKERYPGPTTVGRG